MDDENLLDDIIEIIAQDVSKIRKRASKEQLDRTSASNLVDYANLQIRLNKHVQELERMIEDEKRDTEELEKLKQEFLAASKREVK